MKAEVTYKLFHLTPVGWLFAGVVQSIEVAAYLSRDPNNLIIAGL